MGLVGLGISCDNDRIYSWSLPFETRLVGILKNPKNVCLLMNQTRPKYKTHIRVSVSRLNAKTEGITRLTYTGFRGELEHLDTVETRLLS